MRRRARCSPAWTCSSSDTRTTPPSLASHYTETLMRSRWIISQPSEGVSREAVHSSSDPSPLLPPTTTARRRRRRARQAASGVTGQAVFEARQVMVAAAAVVVVEWRSEHAGPTRGGQEWSNVMAVTLSEDKESLPRNYSAHEDSDSLLSKRGSPSLDS